jgi:hypothetical protein
MLALSLSPATLGLIWWGAVSILALRTLKGSDSLLPPNKEDGARALTEASVSIDLRLLLLEDDASVRMEALSVRRLLAVAVPYVAGWPPLPCGRRCAGRAFGGGDVGNWWENWTLWVLLLVLCDVGAALGVAECMVVKVVAKERTEGAGEENVLSTPRPELPIVVFVAWPEDAAWEAAASECAISVEIVAAVDLFPIVGGATPSTEDRRECLRSSDDVLIEGRVGTVENERW